MIDFWGHRIKGMTVDDLIARIKEVEAIHNPQLNEEKLFRWKRGISMLKKMGKWRPEADDASELKGSHYVRLYLDYDMVEDDDVTLLTDFMRQYDAVFFDVADDRPGTLIACMMEGIYTEEE